jgi:hypothetical protein
VTSNSTHQTIVYIEQPEPAVIIPFLAAAKSRGHAAASMCFGGKPPLALLGRSLL